MPCYRPLTGWNKLGGGLTSRKSASNGSTLTVPCGQCIGCRLDKQRDWTARICHEARLWPVNAWLTITYDEANLPWDQSLNLRHWQLFIKHLRRDLAPRQIRFIAQGEYGDQTGRPHYHAVVFNYSSGDLKIWKPRDGMAPIFLAPRLTALWKKGNVFESPFEPGCANYIAAHCVKRLSQEKAEESGLLQRLHLQTGEWITARPEFWVMSRRPGIGAGYFDRYADELWTHDSVILHNREASVPRYYNRLMEEADPERYARLRDARVAEARKPDRRANNTPARLASREQVTKARLNLKPKRKL